jgi:SAM-dependent methyltransferase
MPRVPPPLDPGETEGIAKGPGKLYHESSQGVERAQRVTRDASAGFSAQSWKAPPSRGTTSRITRAVEIRAQGEEVRRQLRLRTLRLLFERVPAPCFDRCLEIGAGDGFQSVFLANYAGLVVSTDIRLGKLAHPRRENVRYLYCDAEQIPFRSACFDLIFSSHLLEHLPDLAHALAELRSALRDDGLMIHVVPSRFWKLLDFGLFYPSQVVHVIEKYAARGRHSSTTMQAPRDSFGSNVKGPARNWWRRSLWPPVHGIAESNLSEFRRFAPGHWLEQFRRAGMEVVGVIDRLPVHSPYRFGWEGARRLLESLGASSSVAYVVAKTRPYPERASLFLP